VGRIVIAKEFTHSLPVTNGTRVDGYQPESDFVDFILFTNVRVLCVGKFSISEDGEIMKRPVQFNGKVKASDKQINFKTRGENASVIALNNQTRKISGNKGGKIPFACALISFPRPFMLIIITHGAGMGTELKRVLCNGRRWSFYFLPAKITLNDGCFVSFFCCLICALFPTKSERMTADAFQNYLDLIFCCVKSFRANRTFERHFVAGPQGFKSLLINKHFHVEHNTMSENKSQAISPTHALQNNNEVHNAENP